MKISLHDLKERKEDIPLLVEHFINHFNRLKNKNITGVHDHVMEVFLRYNWPGNVRQLIYCIEHAFILCQKGIIQLNHLPEDLYNKNKSTDTFEKRTLKEIEKKAIIETLEKNNWKKMATAKELGIDKNTLRRKILRFNIKNPGTL